MSGLDLQIYLAAIGHRIPIVSLSANQCEGTIERALKAGAADFLPKPPNPEALFGTIRSALKLPGSESTNGSTGDDAKNTVLF